jgi:hypothetical protein
MPFASYSGASLYVPRCQMARLKFNASTQQNPVLSVKGRRGYRPSVGFGRRPRLMPKAYEQSA